MNSLTSPLADRKLDWLDRAICIYLLLPALLFCLWFATPFAALLLSLVGYGSYRALVGGKSPGLVGIRWTWLVAILALSMVWTAIAGVGHLFYANADWVMRDAVLHDLAASGWPPSYTDGNGTPLLLRAPVGYYLPAALIGWLAGMEAANIGIYLWTALGFALFLASACRLFESGKQRVACLLVLALFGGMDLLGYLWAERRPPELGEHIEWWMPYIQYSSQTTLLFWVPNHALPAWLGTLLVLRHWRQPALARITPLLATVIPLWSPLAAIGLFPFFLLGLAWRRDAKLLFSPITCLLFVPAACLIALYLGMGAATVPHGWMHQLSPSIDAFAFRYVLFCLFEFGMLALILARVTQFDLPLRIAIAVLALLPFYFYGPGNDLAMRASIPALLVLGLATVRPLAERPVNLWQILLVLVLGIGAIGALQEPARALLHPAWKAQDQSLPEAAGMMSSDGGLAFPPHYFAQPDSRVLQRLLRKPPAVEPAAVDEP